MASVPMGDGSVWDLGNLPRYGPTGAPINQQQNYKTEPIVKHKAEARELDVFQRIAAQFTKDRLKMIGGWVWREIFVANIVAGLRRTAHQLIDMGLNGRNPYQQNPWYGPSAWNSPYTYSNFGGSTYGTFNAYGQSSAPWTKNYPGSFSNRQPGGYGSPFSGYGAGSIQFGDRSDCESVLNAARESLENQGFVRLGQILGWAGLNTAADASTFMRGWRTLDGFSIAGTQIIYPPMVDLPG